MEFWMIGHLASAGCYVGLVLADRWLVRAGRVAWPKNTQGVWQLRVALVGPTLAWVFSLCFIVFLQPPLRIKLLLVPDLIAMWWASSYVISHPLIVLKKKEALPDSATNG